jgi:hypothetical protein
LNDKQVLRGFLASVEVIPPLIITFQFNPESMTDNKAVKFADRDGELCGNAPGKTYTGGGFRTISFDIKLHGLEQGTNQLNPTGLDNGISTELAKLRSFLYPKQDAWMSLASEQGKRLSSPPKCIFGYGTKILECVVTDITITEQQFNSLLAPVRAEAKITLVVNEEPGNALYELDKQRRNILSALGIQNISVIGG